MFAAAGGAFVLLTTGALGAARPVLPQGGLWNIAFSQLSLRGERSLAVWYSALLLLLVSGACVLCYLAEARQSKRGAGRWAWLVIAAAFAGLSLDEVGSVHERLGEIPGLNLLEGHAYTWVGVLAPPAALCAAALGVFAWRRLRHEPRVAALLVAGTLLFGSVFVQEQIEIERWAARAEAAAAAGVEPGPRLWQLALLEEGTEIAAALLFLAAALLYAHRTTHRGGARLRQGIGRIDVAVTPRELRVASRLVPAALGVGLAGAAALHLLAPAMPHRGDPLPWFSAAVALLAAAAAWLLPPGRGWVQPRAVLSGTCLAWSADQGAVYLLTSNVWEGSPRAESATHAALAVAMLAVTAYVFRTIPPSPLRRRVLLWGALSCGAAVAGHAVAIAVLVFAGHAALFTALVDYRLAAPAALSRTSWARRPAHRRAPA